ncbi:MAG: hypothetical protein JNL73_03855, partial [Anaerolineales bacterium]|nr:hypothetical protein [Anaerolineales bacterium]
GYAVTQLRLGYAVTQLRLGYAVTQLRLGYAVTRSAPVACLVTDRPLPTAAN